MHFKKQTQAGTLIFDQNLTIVSMEYSDYSKIFLAENATKLLKYTGINAHAIELEKDMQLLFGLIYSLELVELKTLKSYININVVNGFI